MEAVRSRGNTNSTAPVEDYVFSKRLEQIGVYAFIIGLALFNLIPFIWLVVSAFGIRPQGYSSLYLYMPEGLTLNNFANAIDPKRGDVLRAMLNSMATVGGAVLLAIVVCTLAGYALSRAHFRGRRELMYGILVLQVIPITATVLPLYLVMRDLKLINTLQGVSLGLGSVQIPFILWVLKGFFDAVPMELEEAAWLDGASRLTALRRVVLPMALPGLGAAAVLAFNNSWGQFFLPLIMLSDPNKHLMPQALFRSIINYTNVDYGMMNAMSFIYIVPSLIFFFFARRYLIKGVMAGAMAGN
ncbi:MAG: carbohydrate ABC transporter permease [Anaerolineae bacterium]|nr:carbohydrate ABC transporter permease [Anaerolineae bacterium]